MKVIYAPDDIEQRDKSIPTVFLAGSIEMGKAIDWQTKLAKALANENVTLYNPRRLDWDSSWTQDIKNDQFRQQVTWELTALDDADIVVIYFDPKTQSPISLLELGLHAPSDKDVIVCCPEGFWRKGNVDITCAYYNIKQVKTLEEIIEEIKLKLKK